MFPPKISSIRLSFLPLITKNAQNSRRKSKYVILETLVLVEGKMVNCHLDLNVQQQKCVPKNVPILIQTTECFNKNMRNLLTSIF